MKSGVVTTVDNVAKFFRAIDGLVNTRVMVGVPAEKALREDGGAINNAALAYIHSNGAPESGIPARPFLVPGIERKRGETVALLRAAGDMALEFRPEAVTRQFHRVGLLNQASARAVITEGIPPHLAESTIAGRIRRVKGARRRAGIAAELAAGTPASRQGGAEGLFTPLIVSSQLLKSVTYVLRRIGKS